MAAAAKSLARRRLKKSTNVRAIQLRTLGASLRALETISATAATRVAMHMMFNQIRRYDRPTWEQEVLATADDEFHLPWRDGVLVGWSWGQGPIVALVHGWEGRGSQMGRFVEPLVRAGYRVVTFDGPAHGDSTVTRGSMADHLAALERLASHLGPIHAVIAHSMGAAAATIAAARGLGANRYVLLAPPSDPRDYFDAAQLAVGFSTTLRDRLLVSTERVVGFRFQELLAAKRAAEIDAAALIVHDRGDRDVELRHGEAIHQAWRGSELMVTEGLGHRGVLKDPTVLTAICSFIGTADA